jgi:hypothetical protein
VGVAAVNFTRDAFEVFGIPTFPERRQAIFAEHEVACYDRWDYMRIPELTEPTVDFWKGVTEVLAKKTGGLDVGVGWPVDRAVQLTDEDLLAAFEALLPLYEIIRA